MEQDTIALKQGQFYFNREKKYKEGFTNTELQDLQTQYSDTLLNYEAADELLNKEKLENIDRIDKSNPYLNKNIQLANGAIGYVTNQGIYKWYSNPTILDNTSGKNMCPSGWANVDAPGDNMNIPMSIIPTTPNLVVGSTMLEGQSCGNEGNNVFVSTQMNSDALYKGCYIDKGDDRAMEMQDNGLYNFTYETCKQRAIDKGSTYFGLQDVKDSYAQCAISNDLASATKHGTVSNYTISPSLWGIYTTNANMAFLGPNGVLLICYNDPNNVLGTAGNVDPGCNGWGSIQNINATYGANCSAPYTSVANGNMNSYMGALINQTEANYVIGSISTNPADGYVPDPSYGCMKAFDLSYTCGNVIKTNHVEGEAGGQNLILDCTNEVNICAKSFILMLKDDGNVVIFKLADINQDPNEYTGPYLWSSNTSTPNSPNSDWVASLGKTGKNYLRSRETLITNEWIGSTNGTTRLIMQADGNFLLYTSTPNTQCITQTDTFKYGGSGINAIYELSGTSNIDNLNKIGYVDENSDLHEYPASMIGLSTNYKIYEKYDSWGNDLPNMPLPNTTVETCTDQCNTNADCTGFMYDISNQNCWLKNKVYPMADKQPYNNGILYAKKPVIINDESCPKDYAEIDAKQWNNYNKGNEMTATTKCGIAKNTENQSNIVNTLKDTLTYLSTQIANKISSTAMPPPNPPSQTTAQYDQYNKINEQIDSNLNIEGMTNYSVNEMKLNTGLIVLQQNYILVFWGLLTVGIVIYLITRFRN